MLKVMIVDDEMIVRIGIQSCINWEEHGCQVIFTCESGEEAIVHRYNDAGNGWNSAGGIYPVPLSEDESDCSELRE